MLSSTTCSAAVTRSRVVTRGSKRSVSWRSIADMLTPTTPSMSLQAVTTCDAQELQIRAEISKEISSVSAATGATGASAGDPHANVAAKRKRKGAKRTVVIVRLAPKLAVVRRY